MGRHLRLGEFLVAVEGVAMMRQLFEGDDQAAVARLRDIRGIVCDGGDLYDLGVDVPALDARSGYARWSETYDQPGNALISVEQPVVWSILDSLPPGEALDAGCGTGRHASHLVDLGHRVVGVDASPEMLDKARAAVPGAEFRAGDLTSLPVETASVHVAVCALAIEHVVELELVIAELARVVRPGGTVVLSDLHPTPRALGGAAYFQDASGGAGVVRGHRHLHGDYLRAFGKADLAVRQCLEPRFGKAEMAMQGPASTFIPEATEAAYLGMPAALVWDLTRRQPDTTS
jgi:ubiquinone/menaquinone biosynthesis C-methylase UbiE